MLLTDGFGGVGGIAKFNRDFLTALDSCPLVERVFALPRLISEPVTEHVPEAVVYERAAARGRAAYLSRLAAYLLGRRKFDLVICGHLYLLPAAWLMARMCRARLVLIIHGVEAWMPTGKFLVDRLARRLDAFIAVSRYTAEQFTRWSKVPMAQAFILPNCVDLDRFRPQQRDMRLVEQYRLDSSKVIMTLGRLAAGERYKGYDQVIDLMPRLLNRFPDLKYLIVGDGNDRARLEAKTKTLDVSDDVIFTGRIPETEKVAHYNLANAFVMPSTGEGFGIVLIEAAACGVPVIGSRTGGSREALLDGELGHLVDPLSQDELYDAIVAALDGRNSRPSAKTQGRLKGMSTFSIAKFRDRVCEWCHQQVPLAFS